MFALGARSDCLLPGVDSVPAGLSLIPRLTARRAAWLSFGYLVREAAWKILDVSLNEFEVGILSGAGSGGSLKAEMFLADQLENGAGYNTYFASHPNRLEALLRGAAAEVLRPGFDRLDGRIHGSIVARGREVVPQHQLREPRQITFHLSRRVLEPN